MRGIEQQKVREIELRFTAGISSRSSRNYSVKGCGESL